jgi:hypothetical protein
LTFSEFGHDEYHIIGAVSRKDAADWKEFKWNFKPVRAIKIPSPLLQRIAKIGEAYEASLIPRFSWSQCRLAGEMMDVLIDECEWLFKVVDDEAVQKGLQEIANMAAFVNQQQSYPNIYWLLVGEPPMGSKSKKARAVKDSVG